ADLVSGAVGLGCPLGVDHELADAGAIAQVDEDEAAVVAARVDPAGERDPLPDLFGPDLAAAEITPLHAVTSERSVPDSTTTTRLAPSRLACVCWPLTERPAKSASARTPAARS